MARPAGTPAWFELTVPDPQAVEAFYAAVAGWQIVASPNPAHGGYRVAHAGDAPVAGLMAPQDGSAPLGWTVYFDSADLEVDARRIVDAGGTVDVAPTDIPDVGRFLAARDPQGVAFALMAAEGDPPRAFTPAGQAAAGHACWLELATPDPAGAFAFYGALFGWTRAGAMPMGEMGDYAFIGERTGGDGCATPTGPTGPGAIMSSTATGAAAGWNWYVHVPDIDAAVAAAWAGGGTLQQEPQEIPGGDHAANVTDPAGQFIGLVGPRKQEQ